jgi:aspartyl-tRNA(Asn)/glutamyl-tRNA(Gln) amidotransferase subunit A
MAQIWGVPVRSEQNAICRPSFDQEGETSIAGLFVTRRTVLPTGDGLDPEVAPAVEGVLDVLRGLGAVVTNVKIPHIRFDYSAGALILASEAFAYHETWLRERPELYGKSLRNRFRSGAFVTGRDYVRAQQMRAVLKREFQAVLGKVDVLVTPTMPNPPAPVGEGSAPEGAVTGPVVLRPFNMAGVPGVSVPCGFTANGLPLGVHVAGRPFEDGMVLRVAHAYERATEWHTRRPPVASRT